MSVNGFLVNNTVQKYNYESLENYNTPDFSTSSTYQVGDYVMYQGKLYKCTTAITTGGAWDSTKWSLAILSDDVADLKSQFNANDALLKENIVTGAVLLILQLEKGGLNANGKYTSATNGRTKDLTKLAPGTYTIHSGDIKVYVLHFTSSDYTSGQASLWGVTGDNTFTVSSTRQFIGVMTLLDSGALPTGINITGDSYLKKQVEQNYTELNNKISQTWSLSEAVSIAANDDLNNYKMFGNFVCNNAIASTLSNAPTDRGGILHVERAGNATPNYLRQTYVTAVLQQTYVRYLNGSVWTDWMLFGNNNVIFDRTYSFNNETGSYNSSQIEIPKLSPNKTVGVVVYPINEREGTINLSFLDDNGGTVIGAAAYPLNSARCIFRILTAQQANSIRSVRTANVGLYTGVVSYRVVIVTGEELDIIKKHVDENIDLLNNSVLRSKNYNFVMYHNYGMGFYQYRPNSIETLPLAVENQYDGYRCNVIRTSDGHFVCSHDLYINYLARNLDGTPINGVTEGNNYVEGCIAFEDVTLANLRQNYSWTSAWPKTTSTISTLEEFLDEFVKHPLKLRIEPKALRSMGRGYFDDLIDIILNHGLNPADVMIESYSAQISGFISDACDYIKIMPWYEYTNVETYVTESQGNGHHTVVPIGYNGVFTSEEIRKIKKMGAIPYTTFLNDINLMANRIKIGYTMGEGYVSNVKDALIAVL